MTKFIVTLALFFCVGLYGTANPSSPNGTGDIVEIPIKQDKKHVHALPIMAVTSQLLIKMA